MTDEGANLAPAALASTSPAKGCLVARQPGLELARQHPHQAAGDCGPARHREAADDDIGNPQQDHARRPRRRRRWILSHGLGHRVLDRVLDLLRDHAGDVHRHALDDRAA